MKSLQSSRRRLGLGNGRCNVRHRTLAADVGTTVSSSFVLYADLSEAFDTSTAAVGVLTSARSRASCVAGRHAYTCFIPEGYQLPDLVMVKIILH